MKKEQKVKDDKNNQIIQRFNSMLRDISQELSTLFDSDYVGIWLINEENKKIEGIISSGEWPEGKADQKKVEMDICNAAISGKIVQMKNKAIFCAPIKMKRIKENKDETLGAIFLHSKSADNYSTKDKNFLSAILNILAFGIWNIRYELNKSSDRESGYTGITSMSVNLQKAISEGLQKILEDFNAQHATVYRYDRETQSFFYPIAKGVSPEFWSHVPRKDGVAAHTVQSSQPIFLNDVNDDHLFSQSSFAKNEKVKSTAATSLGGEGVLFLSYSHRHEFKNDEKQKFKFFARVLEFVFYSLNATEKLKWEGEISETGHWSKAISSFFKEKLIGFTGIDIATLYVYDNHKQNFYLVVGEGTDMRYTKGRPIKKVFIGDILEKKKPIFFESIEGTFLENSHFAKRENVKAVAILPLWNRSSECVGILFINYRQIHSFDENTRKRLVYLANFLTIILEAVLKETELNRAIRILKKLQAFKSVEKAEDIDLMLQTMADGINFLKKADLVMILRRHQKAQEFFEGGFYGMDKKHIHKKIPLRIGQEVVKSKEELTITDLEDQYKDNILFTIAGIRTLRCIPLIHSGDVVGLVYVGFKSKRHVFSKNEWQLVDVMLEEASQRIGIFLSNFQLKEKRKQLESLLEIGKIIHPLNLNKEQTLKKVTQIITDKLGYKRGIVSLKETVDGKNYFKRVAFVGLDSKIKKELSQRYKWNTEEQMKKIFRKEFKISRSYYIGHEHKEEVEGLLESVCQGEPDETRKSWEWHPDDMLLIPLQKKNEIIGLLSVDSPIDKSIPTKESVKTLEVFAEHLVLAIENALKYERRKKELDGLKAVVRTIKNKIGTGKGEEYGLRSVLKSIIKESRRVIDHIEYANIYLKEDSYLVKKEKHISDPSRYLGGDQIAITKEDSIVAMVARNRKSVIINDLTEKNWKNKYYATYLGMKSELAVPIMKGRKVIGVINVESPKLKAFNDKDRNYLKMLADESVNALQQTIPYAQREQRLKEFNILNSIEQKTGSSLDIKEIAEHTLEVVLQSARSEIGNITVWHEETKELELLALYDCGNITMEVRYDHGITILAVKDKKEFYIANLDLKCPCCPKGTWRENHYYEVWGKSIKSELAVPIIYNDRVLGVLNLESPQVDAFEDHIPLIKYVARMLGRAIEKVRQYEEKLKDEQGRAQRDLWGFIGQTMVHEFRKKLATIRGNEANLKTKIRNKEQLKLLENNERIAIDMLFELMRLPRETSMEKFEIHGVLNEIIGECKTYRDYHNDIMISTNFGEESIVEANKKCLHIIIENLIENAFTAMPKGGVLSVITKKLMYQTEIIIRDTGVGIPDHLKKKLFTSPIQSKRGMGIFLVISKSLMNSFKGDIHLIESQENKGTSIRLWLRNVR